MARNIKVGKKGLCAQVDDADYPLLSQFSWSPQVCGNTTYAVTHVNGKFSRMHRLIMAPPRNLVVDHLDRDGLNNQRSNLEVCTQAENLRNRGLSKNNTSGVIGVSRTASGKWKAQITFNYIVMYLGTFETIDEARRARRTAEVELWRDPQKIKRIGDA